MMKNNINSYFINCTNYILMLGGPKYESIRGLG